MNVRAKRKREDGVLGCGESPPTGGKLGTLSELLGLWTSSWFVSPDSAPDNAGDRLALPFFTDSECRQRRATPEYTDWRQPGAREINRFIPYRTDQLITRSGVFRTPAADFGVANSLVRTFRGLRLKPGRSADGRQVAV
jgi:hypothetical protein